MNFPKTLLIPVALAILATGCSTVGVRVLPSSQRKIEASAGLPQKSWSDRLEFLIGAARRSWPGAVRGERQALTVYNAAVGGVVEYAAKHGLLSGLSPSPDLEIVRSGEGILDPRPAAEVIAASRVRISGLAGRAVQSGPGVPYVLHYRKGSPPLIGQPGISRAGVFVPATACLRFDGGSPRLAFISTLHSDRIRADGRRIRLAADFSAPLALTVSRTGNRAIDITAMFLTRQRLARAGLFQFQPFDPDKVPVVFVHGLMSRPEAWTAALNGLLEDRTIRERYQFWFLFYPSGLPVWKSAALLRSELDRYQTVLESRGRIPVLHKIVLVGHSMGGLISSLVIRQGGDALWNQFSRESIDQLPVSEEARGALERLFFFEAREDIARVIFIATPHRGSGLALNPVALVASRLIMLPRILDPIDRRALVASLNDDVRRLFATPASSLRFLQAESPLITSIQNLPLSRTIPYHSIIGDRGRGDSPNSSDGVVPYSSSHLPTAVSEKIVPSDHGAQGHPQAIAEMRRILTKNLYAPSR